jgi:hypothetical protein
MVVMYGKITNQELLDPFSGKDSEYFVVWLLMAWTEQ